MNLNQVNIWEIYMGNIYEFELDKYVRNKGTL